MILFLSYKYKVCVFIKTELNKRKKTRHNDRKQLEPTVTVILVAQRAQLVYWLRLIDRVTNYPREHNADENQSLRTSWSTGTVGQVEQWQPRMFITPGSFPYSEILLDSPCPQREPGKELALMRKCAARRAPDQLPSPGRPRVKGTTGRAARRRPGCWGSGEAACTWRLPAFLFLCCISWAPFLHSHVLSSIHYFWLPQTELLFGLSW